MHLSKTQLAIIALIVANIIWGAAAPIFKWSLEDIQPMTLGFLRFAIASIIFFPFAWNRSIEKKDILPLILLSSIGITFAIALFFYGVRLTESINVPIIGSSGPVFIILFSWVYLREKMKRKIVLGTLTALLGVLTIVLLPLLGGGIDGSIQGNLLIIASTFAGVLHIILSKKIMAKYDVLTITFWSFTIAALTFLPFFMSEELTNPSLSNIGAQGIIGVLFGGFLSSALAFYLFYWALKYFPASEVGIFAYLDPVIAILIAAPLLGELPTPLYILGSLLVFGGIFIAEGRLHYHPIHKLKSS